MLLLFVVFLGGGIGAILRYILSNIFKVEIFSIPLTIILINVIGCFAMGILNTLIGIFLSDNMYLKYFFIVGLLGSFTTFSTFSLEAISLFEKQGFYYFFIYVFLSVMLSILAFFSAHLIMKKVFF